LRKEKDAQRKRDARKRDAAKKREDSGKNNKAVENNDGILGNEAENRVTLGKNAPEKTVPENPAKKLAEENRKKNDAAQRKAMEKQIQEAEAKREAERLLEEARLQRLATQNQAQLCTNPSVEQPGGVGNMASTTTTDRQANLPGPPGGEQGSFGQGVPFEQRASGSGQTSFGEEFSHGEKWLDNIDFFCKQIFSTPRMVAREIKLIKSLCLIEGFLAGQPPGGDVGAYLFGAEDGTGLDVEEFTGDFSYNLNFSEDPRNQPPQHQHPQQQGLGNIFQL
jgi:hypothetical protein